MKGGALSPVTIHLSSKIAPGWALEVKYEVLVKAYNPCMHVAITIGDSHHFHHATCFLKVLYFVPRIFTSKLKFDSDTCVMLV